MRSFILSACCAILLLSCGKHMRNEASPDIHKTYTSNSARVTVKSGIWGTIAMQEGNCMPTMGTNMDCKTYPVKRTVRIYEYTLPDAAVPTEGKAAFYDSFSTRLVKEVSSDKNGFYQADVPPGRYTVVVIEDGKMYANISDGQGGLNPAEVNASQPLEHNVTLTYKATF